MPTGKIRQCNLFPYRLGSLFPCTCWNVNFFKLKPLRSMSGVFDDIIVIPNKNRACTRIQIDSTSRRFWLHCDRHRISVGNLSSTNLPTPNRSARNSIHSVHQEKTLYLTFVCLTVTFLVCHLPRHSSLELGTCEKNVHFYNNSSIHL